MATLLAVALAPPLLAACLFDVRHRIIPDWTVVAVAVVGLAGALLSQDLVGALAAGFACLLLGALAARAGLWGWGDAKLIGAAGLVVGAEGLMLLLLGTAIAGGSLAALLLALRGPARAGHLALPAGAPRWLRAEHRRLRRFPTVPYALAIAAGVVTALLKG